MDKGVLPHISVAVSQQAALPQASATVLEGAQHLRLCPAMQPSNRHRLLLAWTLSKYLLPTQCELFPIERHPGSGDAGYLVPLKAFRSLSGGILEANLAERGTKYYPSFGFEDWAADSMAPRGYKSRDLRHSMMETGDGLLVQSNDRAVDLPPILRRRSVNSGRRRNLRKPVREGDAHYRLDDGVLNVSGVEDVRTLAQSFGAMTLPLG
jgi:hypothetical protein